MPQPMSTPTAAGATAPRMAMTEPTGGAAPDMNVGHHRHVVRDPGQASDGFELAAASDSTS